MLVLVTSSRVSKNLLIVVFLFIVSILFGCVSVDKSLEDRIQEIREKMSKISPPGGVGGQEQGSNQLPNYDGELVLDKNSKVYKNVEEEQRLASATIWTDNEITTGEEGLAYRFAKELSQIDRALRVEPKDSNVKTPYFILELDKINKLYVARKYELALVEINSLLKIYSNSHKLLTMKGTVYQKLGYYDLALSAYEKAFQFLPSERLRVQIKYLKNFILYNSQAQLGANNSKGKALVIDGARG